MQIPPVTPDALAWRPGSDPETGKDRLGRSHSVRLTLTQGAADRTEQSPGFDSWKGRCALFLSCADLNNIGLLHAGLRRTPLMKSAEIKRWLRRAQLATLPS